MKNFLRSIKIIQDFSLTLNCSKSYFLKKLQENVGAPGYEFFERFRTGTPFKGRVGNSDFKIRQRAHGLHKNPNLVVSFAGTVIERDEKAVVNIEASTNNWFLAFFYAFVLFVYSGMVVGMVTSSSEVAFPVLLFLPVHAALMVGLPYVMARRQRNEL